MPARSVDLDQVLCHEEERDVGQDNVVSLEGTKLQLGKKLLGRFDAKGRAVVLPKAIAA